MAIIFSSTTDNHLRLVLNKEEKPASEYFKYSLYLTNDIHNGSFLNDGDVLEQALKIAKLIETGAHSADLHSEQVELVKLLIKANEYTFLSIANKIFKEIIEKDQYTAMDCLVMLLKNDSKKVHASAPMSVYGHSGETMFSYKDYSAEKKIRGELIEMAKEIISRNTNKNEDEKTAALIK